MFGKIVLTKAKLLQLAAHHHIVLQGPSLNEVVEPVAEGHGHVDELLDSGDHVLDSGAGLHIDLYIFVLHMFI